MKTRILLFEEFLNEAYKRAEFQKVMITRRADLDDSFITGPEYSTHEYWTIITREDEPTTVPKDLPVLNYDRKTLEKMIKAGAIRDNQVYNKLQAREKVSSKAEFYKAHTKSGFIIPTVLDPKAVKELNFPVVAKPDNNHSGLGIKVFETPESMDSVDLSQFSSFSEKIKIKEEHRFFVWRSEVIQWTERKPMDDETKDIAKKAEDKETNFAYILREETPGDEFLKCIAYFGDYHSDLDFYAIDIAKTEDDKVYVFEINSEPGALFGVMALVYERIYEDWYETQLSDETTKLLKEFRLKDIKQNQKQNPNWQVKK
jgi:glutathione synthase/RimK-type ligase-like ATP-grasp enzyme